MCSICVKQFISRYVIMLRVISTYVNLCCDVICPHVLYCKNSPHNASTHICASPSMEHNYFSITICLKPRLHSNTNIPTREPHTSLQYNNFQRENSHQTHTYSKSIQQTIHQHKTHDTYIGTHTNYNKLK